jgi:hypothetical protein
MVFGDDKVNMISSWVTFLTTAGIKLNYLEGKMEWFDCSIPLHPLGGLDSRDFDVMDDMFFIQVELISLVTIVWTATSPKFYASNTR